MNKENKDDRIKHPSWICMIYIHQSILFLSFNKKIHRKLKKKRKDNPFLWWETRVRKNQQIIVEKLGAWRGRPPTELRSDVVQFCWGHETPINTLLQTIEMKTTTLAPLNSWRILLFLNILIWTCSYFVAVATSMWFMHTIRLSALSFDYLIRYTDNISSYN